MANLEKSPAKRGGRGVTITLRATKDDVARIDRIARGVGMTRAAFMMKCANLGYRQLRAEGKVGQ